MVKNMSETLLSSLPNFWKIARSFIEGKFKRVRLTFDHGMISSRQQLQPSGSRRSAQQCSQMALDIIKLYVSLLSECFSLSDTVVMQRNNNDPSPKLLPRHSNSLTTAHFLVKILIEIQDCANEMTGMDIVPDASSSLGNLVESARWKFGDILVRAWLRGCHRDLLSCMLLTMMTNRRSSVPPPRNVDTIYVGSFCDTIYVSA